MKKYFYLLIAAIGLSVAAKAGPEDTTWVQANFNDSLEWYGTHDTAVTFPSNTVTYRKIYMIFTLGKHQCPGYSYACGQNGNPPCPTGGTPWCADWDYTIQNFLMTSTGDTVELGRLITPYANAGGSLPGIPYGWTKKYIYDVTDYAPLLRDAATVRIFFSGYSGGFLGDIKFAFIEGTPDRTVTGVRSLWNGSFGYGNTADPINNHFPVVSETAPTGTQSAALKFIVTGHGSDNNGCCEFMSHNYQVLENSSQIDQYTIWRPTCGANELYPQSGTWLYERGNWCPGAIVYTNTHNLQNITAGTTFTTNIAFDAYTSPNGGGSYTTSTALFYYGGMNKTLDASLDEIKAPNIDNDYFRENPAGKPTVHVKNTGSTTINSIQFQYGVQGNYLPEYTWQGTLASLQDTDIVLPEAWVMRQVSGSLANYNFVAKIIQVNGVADEDSTNNTMTSVAAPTPQWPVNIIVVMKTNNEGNNGICETSWQIFDIADNLVASRTNAAFNTTYRDTLTLGPSAYRLVVTDGGCDGLSWWAFPSGTTKGSINVDKGTGAVLPLAGNSVATYPNDFGCGFTQYFTTAWPTGVENISDNALSLEAYPNPAQSDVTVSINGLQVVKGTLQMMDAVGRIVLQQECSISKFKLNLSNLSNGLYTLVYVNDNTPNNRLQTRIVVAK